jgi:hypothetical protein
MNYNNILKSLIVLFIVLLFSLTAKATEYYKAPSGKIYEVFTSKKGAKYIYVLAGKNYYNIIYLTSVTK